MSGQALQTQGKGDSHPSATYYILLSGCIFWCSNAMKSKIIPYCWHCACVLKGQQVKLVIKKYV